MALTALWWPASTRFGCRGSAVCRRSCFVPSQRFEIVEDDRFEGEWKVRTLAYIYRIYIDSRRLAERVEVMAWHWHPDRTPKHVEPHIHVRVNHPLLGLALRKLHIPTGRVSFEEVVRFLVDELRVLPIKEEWREIVGETEHRFREYRTWA